LLLTSAIEGQSAETSPDTAVQVLNVTPNKVAPHDYSYAFGSGLASVLHEGGACLSVPMSHRHNSCYEVRSWRGWSGQKLVSGANFSWIAQGLISRYSG